MKKIILFEWFDGFEKFEMFRSLGVVEESKEKV